MSRFQAKTNAVVEQELEFLREEMGLRQNQKADLLRELASLAGWMVRQARQGRAIQAQGDDSVQVLTHPILERLQRQGKQHLPGKPMLLSDGEIEKLSEILNKEFHPSPSLRKSLQHIADPDRSPPHIEWRDSGV